MSETRYWRCPRCEAIVPGSRAGYCEWCEEDGIEVEREPVVVMPEAEAAALRRGPWVPCKERRPKEVGHYVVTLRHERDDQSFTDMLVWGGSLWDVDEGWVVLAWQPPPAPWDGEP